ncbi:MAG: hypothetical protein Q9227_006613 [Pyrenula ochraceoflavens]
MQSGLIVLAESFDYVVVGAGTCGLAIANRLSEDPSVTVVVVEPGTDQRNNTLVSDPLAFGQAWDTPIDWHYMTAIQPGADNRQIDLHQGRAWGGTSTVNGDLIKDFSGMTYIRGDRAELDAWEDLGNHGWNWEALLPYYKKAEKYSIPSQTELAAGATYDSEYHGFDGPVHVGYTPALVNGSFAQPIIQTWESLSLPHSPDLNSGHTRGFGMGPQTLHSELNLRWDSARAYLYPVQNRRNLKVIQGTVSRLTWASGNQKIAPSNSALAASGVEYLTNDGQVHNLKAKKEVIVSAGAVRTPLVLESSGIGNPSSLGIKTRINLPGVGEHLIEQPNHILAFSGTLDPCMSAYHTFATVTDLFGNKTAKVEASTQASLQKWAQAAVDASGKDALEINSLLKLLQLQHDLLFKQNVTAAEILTVSAPGGLLASNYWILFPFSRGSVHLGAADRINEPVIDPRFFLADFDLSAQLATGKLAQSFWLRKPMSAFVGDPLNPGPDLLPNNATDAQWEAYLRSTLAANSHSLGTASMMSRDLGGVVDPNLKVYGTANVRVVDASVLPTQLSGHLTATLYAVAERAADIIKRAAAVV